jgi:hypothetical protein
MTRRCTAAGCVGAYLRRSMRRCGMTAVLALLVLGVAALPVAAHETDPSIVAELLEITPAPPAGLTIQVVTSVEAQLVVENTTGTELTVIATGGEPFLRIGPDGVLVNRSSPDWYRTNDPSGLAPVPERAQDPEAEPDWARVSREPSWGWFDHRLHDRPLTLADLDVEEGRLYGWEIPMRYGDEDLRVIGQVARRPIRGAVTAALQGSGELAEGVSLALLPGPFPGLFLSSARDDEVLVRGPDGEPFLRLGPAGAHVNVRSPAWAQNASARGQTPEAEVDPAAPPEWLEVATVPRFGWLEPRARPAEDPPAEVVEGGRAVTLGRWEVPVEVGGDTVLARGVTTWQPSGATGPGATAAGPVGEGLPRAAILAAAAAVLGAGVLVSRRRSTTEAP